MCRYEILFLASPEVTKDETESIKSHFSKVIRSHKGDVLSFEKWGKYKLAYPVNKNEYGVYFLTRFEVDEQAKNKLIAELKDAFIFKFNTFVMKSHFERLNLHDSLDYKRPESLEESPQDVDSFLKRNEMEGLLKKGPVRKSAGSKESGSDVDFDSRGRGASRLEGQDADGDQDEFDEQDEN